MQYFLQVSLYLPPLKQVRNVIERMKNLSMQVTLAGNRNGVLVISVSTDTVNASTHFKNLSMPSWGKIK